MEHLLIQAVLNEDASAVEALLQQGIDPNVFEDADRITPLHFIAQKDSDAALEIAQMLMNAGANPHSKTEPDGQTPLEIAKLMSNHDMVTIFLGANRETH